MTLGQRIKRLREGRDLTQEQLAKSLKVIRGTLSNWEIDRAIPDLETIKRIAEFFGVSLDYLLDYKSNIMVKMADKPDPIQSAELPPELQKMIEAAIENGIAKALAQKETKPKGKSNKK